MILPRVLAIIASCATRHQSVYISHTSTDSHTMDKASDFFRRLNENVDAWYADTITFDEFTTRNGAIWREIERDGYRDAVRDLWRASAQVVHA